MIWKVFKTEISRWQLGAAFAGAFAGMVIVLAALGFYFDVIGVFDDSEGFWKEEYIIISKRISSSETVLQIDNQQRAKPTFTPEEIDELKSQAFVSKLTPFSNCSFGVAAFTDNDSPLAGFYTDLFFEAVPAEYIDVNYDNWSWNESDAFVPVILPKTYLNLYNFGFATSQNLPQVSEESASLVKFNVVVHGQGKKEKLKAHIVGFSDRINTLLVPEEFIRWGNQNFGTGDSYRPSRLIVVANDPSDAEMFRYFEEKSYDVNKSELSNSKALMFLRIIISLVVATGLLITVLAFWLLVTSILLLLQKNRENIIKLGLLGYQNKSIAKPYNILSAIMILSVVVLAVLPLMLIRHYYVSQLVVLGYAASSSWALAIATTALGFIVVLVVLCLVFIRMRVNYFLK